MALELFAESFGGYKVAAFSDLTLLANFQQRWTAISQVSSAIVSDGRSGPGLTLNGVARKTCKHSNVFTGGFAFRPNATPGGVDPIFRLLNNDVTLFRIMRNIDNTLTIQAGDTPSSVNDTTDRALHNGVFYWIDFTVSFSGATPIQCNAEMRINTNIEASIAGSTGNNASSLISGDATANVFQLTTSSSGTYSDFYIKNQSGYYGDVQILPLVPNGDVVGDFTPSTGTVHYVLVNTVPVDLSKFVESNTPGDKDIWDWQDCPGFSGTVKAVNIRVLAGKDDEGTRSFKIIVGDTGSEDQSAEFFVSDFLEEYYEHSLELDPGTGLAWTQAGFNAKRFGVQIIS